MLVKQPYFGPALIEIEVALTDFSSKVFSLLGSSNFVLLRSSEGTTRRPIILANEMLPRR
jgi:hypothetical protein